MAKRKPGTMSKEAASVTAEILPVIAMGSPTIIKALFKSVKAKHAFQRAFKDEPRARLVEELLDDFRSVFDYYLLPSPVKEQFVRRMSVRAAVAYFEGVLFAIQEIMLEGHEKGTAAPSVPEVAILQERSYRINNRGYAHEATKFTSTPAKLKFLAKLAPKALGFPLLFKFSDAGYEAFKKAIELRNRITHPKPDAGLDVKDEDFVTIADAWKWFQTAINALEAAPQPSQ